MAENQEIGKYLGYGITWRIVSGDEYILGIPIGPVDHIGTGIAKLVSWEWKWE